MYGVRRRRGTSAHKSRSGELGELELVGRDADLAGAMLRPDGFRGSADDEGTRDDGEADGGVLASEDEADS